MHILNDTFIECNSCGSFFSYTTEDIKCSHELHDETSKVYSYKIDYIECSQCRSKIVLHKERISPGT